MKKTILSTFMNLDAVEALDTQKLYSLKGGCGSCPSIATTTSDDDDDDDGGGEDNFIPPPGGD